MTSTMLCAIPAKRVRKTVRTEDGTMVEVVLKGDEYGHWYEDKNGRCLKETGNGTFRMFSADEAQTMKREKTRRMSMAQQRRIERLEQKTRFLTKRRAARTNAAGDATTPAAGQQRAAAADGSRSAYTGEKKGLVILVNFADKSMSRTDIREVVNDMFNKEGFSDFKHAGSVSDYFHDQSYGQLHITFDVVGPYTMAGTMKYYGENDINGNDKRPALLVSEAVKAADAEVDFADYDWDNDGEVDQVYVIYAGYAESAGAESYTIWPHEWTLSSAQYYGYGDGPVTLDGKKIDTYAMSSELASTTGENLAGIGTACHEFSHCLGLPDTYDTSYSGGAGMMSWDLMDSGNYNGYYSSCECPAQYTAYERWMAGWITPVELDKPCMIKDMTALHRNDARAYVIYNDANRDEFYILENRQECKWDILYRDHRLGHGMFVTHIDYDETAWLYNEVNNVANHQRITYIPADNSFGTYNEAGGYYETSVSEHQGDTYPGTSGNGSLTDTTTPAATLYNKNTSGDKLLNKPITNITENADGTIAFTFMGGVGTPEISANPSYGENNTATVTWNEVEGAESYDVMLTPVQEGIDQNTLLKETFSKCTNTSTTAITDFDSYMDNTGWSGTKVFPQESGYVKLGNSKTIGSLNSPYFDVQSGYVTVYIEGRQYSSSENKLELNFFCNDTDVANGYTTMELAEAWTPYAVTMEQKGRCMLTLFGDKRCYLRNVTVIDGSFSLTDILANQKVKAQMPLTAVTGNGTTAAASEDGNGTITVEGVTGTSYTFTALKEGHYYARVRSNLEAEHSAWSLPVSVFIDNTTAIREVGNDGGKTAGTIYTVSGQAAGTDTRQLNSGIYIRGGKKFVAVKR